MKQLLITACCLLIFSTACNKESALKKCMEGKWSTQVNGFEIIYTFDANDHTTYIVKSGILESICGASLVEGSFDLDFINETQAIVRNSQVTKSCNGNTSVDEDGDKINFTCQGNTVTLTKDHQTYHTLTRIQ